MADKVGVIGLGLMGKPMALNLASAGYSLVVHNRSRSVVDELVQTSTGISAASSPVEVAERASIVITMLPTPPDVEKVVLGEDGVIAGMKSGSLLIDMSTNAPEISIEIERALAAIGAGALDAPVSGGDKGAIDATLSIMVGGSEGDFHRALPIFQALGETVVHCGGVGAGQTVKACNQIVVAVAYQAISEALVLGSKAGVDPEKIIQVLNGGLAATRVMELRGRSMIRHEFEPGGRAELHLKDLGIALATGKRLNVPLPVTATLAQAFQRLQAQGRGHLDHSALLTLVEDMANHQVSAKTGKEETAPGS